MENTPVVTKTALEILSGTSTRPHHIPTPKRSLTLQTQASPGQPSTMSGSNNLRRTLSRETVASSVSNHTILSQPSIFYPAPPPQSIAGDAPIDGLHPTTHEDMDHLAESLEHLSPNSVTDSESPLSEARTLTPTELSKTSSVPPDTYEHSNWGLVASEDVELGLKRLAMLAKDEHTKDPSKSVQEYYSARLAKLIKRAEVEFDPKELAD